MTDNKPIFPKQPARLAPPSRLGKARLEQRASAPAIARPAAAYIYAKHGFTAHALQGCLQAFPDQD